MTRRLRDCRSRSPIPHAIIGNRFRELLFMKAAWAATMACAASWRWSVPRYGIETKVSVGRDGALRRPRAHRARNNVCERTRDRSEEHTSELQSHSFISYAVFCLK